MAVIFMGSLLAKARLGRDQLGMGPGGELVEPRLIGGCSMLRPGQNSSHYLAGFSTPPGGVVDSGAPPRIIRPSIGDLRKRPAGPRRRRRSNRPGTSQAKGPQVDGT